jgi:hypothetical protein
MLITWKVPGRRPSRSRKRSPYFRIFHPQTFGSFWGLEIFSRALLVRDTEAFYCVLPKRFGRDGSSAEL